MNSNIYNRTSFIHFLLQAIFCCLLLSRKDNPNKKTIIDIQYSRTQQYLFKILENYQAEYNSDSSSETLDKLREKYSKNLEYFLVDSLGRYIDSMKVMVDTVIQDGWMVTTKFHTKEIEFKYGMMFKDSMDSKNDSLFRFMKGLKTHEEVLVNFVLLGSGELNTPNDKSIKTIRIFAYPVPLDLRTLNK